MTLSDYREQHPFHPKLHLTEDRWEAQSRREWAEQELDEAAIILEHGNVVGAVVTLINIVKELI